ncbi:MAG: hypothetical protein JWN87_2912 [Frankiales bacterium]|jgi:hypothetical protein|nr:hypothetical protein [Frankiales bacterium]MCW2585137.1 hypothetical protein [Frankiales bacterium]
MSTPDQRRDPDAFVAEHASLDERLTEAFRRYDAAFHGVTPSGELVRARMDLSLLLWGDEDAPEPVQEQLAHDGLRLLRETPPLQ